MKQDRPIAFVPFDHMAKVDEKEEGKALNQKQSTCESWIDNIKFFIIDQN